MKDCTETAASASRSSSVGSIIWSSGDELCRKFSRLFKIVAQREKRRKGEEEKWRLYIRHYWK